MGLYISPFSKGNRQNLIKISCTNGLTKGGNVVNLINGQMDAGFYFFENRSNQWILFEFNESVCIQEIKWYQGYDGKSNYPQGRWILQGSNNNIDFINLGDSFILNDGTFAIKNNKKFQYYKLQQIDGTTINMPWLHEIEFGILMYKCLIKENDKYYSIKPDNYDTSTKMFKPLNLNGGNFPNKLDFDNYGIDDLNILTADMTCDTETFKPMSKFNKIQIVSGIEDATTTNVENTITAIAPCNLVIPKNPKLLLSNIKRLNKLTVTSNVTGSGVIKYAVSFDGKQYKTWNGLVWENIELTPDNVKNKGMSVPTINSITTWEAIRNNSTEIWLVKYIEKDLPSNKCEIDKEEINFNENGYWRSLTPSEQNTHPITYGKNENNLFDSATVTNNSGVSENLMITSLSFVTTTDTKFKTFSVTGSNDLVSSVENGTLTFNSKNKTIKMVSDDTTDTINFDVDINTLPTF